MIPADQQIIQFSWVVADVDEAAARWHRTSGIGPFLVGRHLKLIDPKHRGKPQVTDFSIAVAQAGPIQIELVQQHDDTPSCYRDTLAPGVEGLHHVAFIAQDYDAALAFYTDQGFAVASEGRFGDVRFCYVDTSSALGHMVEILEDTPAIRAFFAAVVKAAEGWDRNPETAVRDM